MTLIKCKKCKKDVNDSAFVCPHCGYKLKKISNNSNEDDGLTKEIVIEMLDDVEKMDKKNLTQEIIVEELVNKYKINNDDAIQITEVAQKEKVFMLKIIVISIVILIVGLIIFYELLFNCHRCKKEIKKSLISDFNAINIRCSQKDRDGRGRFLYNCSYESSNNRKEFSNKTIIAMRSPNNVKIKYKDDIQLEQFFKHYSCWGENKSNGIDCLE